MANCKSCGTRIGTRDRNCPNCGRTLGPGSSHTGQKPLDADLTAPSQEAAPPKVTPAPTPEPTPEPEPKPEPKPTPEAKIMPEPKLKPRPQAKPELEETAEVELSEAVEEAAAGSPFSLGPEELLARITEDPTLLEPGLSVYRDPQSGEIAGVELSTEVGEIDLLAEDPEGALVVVKLAGSGAGDVVGPVLEQMGWVSKHIAKDERSVRALVLLEPPAPELGYAARAVADTVSFKTWRITVAVDDVTL
jgi:hypothetical protein